MACKRPHVLDRLDKVAELPPFLELEKLFHFPTFLPGLEAIFAKECIMNSLKKPLAKKACLSVSSACYLLLILFTPFSQANAAGLQLNAYGGISWSTFNSSSEELIGETDKLRSNGSTADVTEGLGISYTFMPSLFQHTHSQWLHDVSLGMDLLFFNTQDSGTVYQYGEEALGNYHYDMYFDTARVMVDTVVGFHPVLNDYIPFVKASVGAASVRTSYSEAPLLTDFGGQIGLPSQTSTNLAYSAGLGVKKVFMKHLQVSLMYLFTDLGLVTTSVHSNDPGNPTTLLSPITTRLQSNAALLELSYLFG